LPFLLRKHEVIKTSQMPWFYAPAVVTLKKRRAINVKIKKITSNDDLTYRILCSTTGDMGQIAPGAGGQQK